MLKKIEHIITNLSVNNCVLLMTISVAILSVIIPIIQSRLSKIEFNIIESQGQLNQSEIRNSQALYFANFANYLITIDGFEKNERLQELWKINIEEAKKNLRYRLALLYTSINDKYPDKTLLDKWNKMEFKQLEEELDKDDFLEKGWRSGLKKKVVVLSRIRYISYALALIFYSIGMLGLNLRKKVI